MAAHHDALISTMVLISAAEGEMTDAELSIMGRMVRYLPVFEDFDQNRLIDSTQSCADLLKEEDGLEKILTRIRESLPDGLRETGYALACTVAIADGRIAREEDRMLELLRDRLGIDRLVAAAIERTVGAVYVRI
jgi:tellurite resistance protein